MNLLLHWPDKSYSVVSARDLSEAFWLTDEIGNPCDCKVAKLPSQNFAIDFESLEDGVVADINEGSKALAWQSGAEFFSTVVDTVYSKD